MDNDIEYAKIIHELEYTRYMLEQYQYQGEYQDQDQDQGEYQYQGEYQDQATRSYSF